MEATFWIDRWREGRIGFHEGRANAHLEQFADRLAPARRVLVPLCGKTEDLAFLAARGHEVIGVELVEDAARAFFVERGVTPAIAPCGRFTAYRAGTLTILVGDFFAATAAELGVVDGIYDRAALVALPAPMRARYVAHLRALVAPAAVGLVITIEYDQARMDGPPFAVLEDELRALYDGARVELLADRPAPGERTGAVGARERCFVVSGAAR